MNWRAQVQTGLLAVVGFSLAAGCSTKHYRESADREAYAAIGQKSWQVKNMARNFTIEQTNQLSFEGLPRVDQVEEFLGPWAEAERGAYILSLEKTLDLGVKYSRMYQNRKEQLYLSALGLTLSRHAFAPIFSGGSRGAQYSGSRTEVARSVPDPNDPSGSNLVQIVQVAERHQVTVPGSVNLSWLLRDIGRITAAITADFTRVLTGGPQSLANSSVMATFSRPLLRNAGYKAEMENLTQAERDLLYESRSFTAYRQRFSVDIATAYYGVLQNRDAARNAYLNLQNSKKMAEQTRALAAEGRKTQSDLGVLQQQELSAESGWVNATRSYKRALDDFKIQLGLPVDANLVLDDRELAQLKIQHPEFNIEDAIQVAQLARLDYQNQKDQFDDAVRKVLLAADSLKTQLDFTAQGNVNSKTSDPLTGRSTGLDSPLPNLNYANWSAGFIVDLPLDRKAERNAYRASLITEERAKRSLAELKDQIELQVRESWRSLEQARRNYEISEVGVKLAERRVEEQTLLAELGRAQALTQVDAQNALVNSKNQRTQALVGHTIARLQFWNNMGILYIKDNGQWEEKSNAKAG